MNNYSLLKETIEGSDNNLYTIFIVLIILVTINIVVEIIKFFSSAALSDKDKKNKRHLLIEEKRIKVLEKLFKSMDSLTLLDQNDEALMLTEIKSINIYITQNKIYIPKKFLNCSFEILDYFKNVLTDFREKSIEKETQLFGKFYDEFNR